MRVKTDQFLAEFAIETRHNRDDDDQYRHSEHHSGDAQQRDHRHKRTFRTEIPKRQTQLKGETKHAPDVGEHSSEILRDAGYSAAEIAALKQSGAVAGS